MIKKFSLCLLLSSFVFSSPVYAQAAYQSQGQTGVFGRSSYTTNNYRRPDALTTNRQRVSNLPVAGLGGVAGVYGGTRVNGNGLPPTRLDSFVHNAGGSANRIYGDEGVFLPPFEEFTKGHRINHGIRGRRDAGLTTGHGSYMADAWGGDEYVDGPEFSQSGANAGNARHFSRGQYLGADPTQTPADLLASLPPPPGPGYQAVFRFGGFVGYMSPNELRLYRYAPSTALRSFYESSRFRGDNNQRRSLLNQIGALASPF